MAGTSGPPDPSEAPESIFATISWNAERERWEMTTFLDGKSYVRRASRPGPLLNYLHDVGAERHLGVDVNAEVGHPHG